jgi:hypothetical protein
MKKTFLLLIVVITTMVFVACKDKKDKDDTLTRMVVVWKSTCGDYIVSYREGFGMHSGYPENLPEEYKIDEISLMVTYRFTGKEWRCNTFTIPIINIIKIEEL